MDLFFFLRSIEDLVSDGTELRTAVRCDDLSHDVASEGRTNLDQVGVFFHLQSRAVSRKTGMEAGSHSGSKAASDVGRSDQDGGWLDLLDEVGETVCITFDVEVFQLLMIIDKDFVGAILQELLDVLFRLMPYQQCIDRMIDDGGKLSGFA